MVTKSIPYWLVVTLFAWAYSSISLAGDDHHHEHRSHSAHVHGEAKLSLALEGNTLEINLESPSVNIVGFEHKASTPEQAHAVEEAEALLKSTQKLFIFSGTRCDVKEVKVDVSGLENEHLDHHEDDHGHHDEHHGHDDTHSEIGVNYSFTCAQGEKLTSVTVELLNQFPGIEEMDVMWITEAGQGAVELNPGTKHIHLR